MPLNLGSVRGRKSQANVKNKGLFHASDYSMQSQCMRLIISLYTPDYSSVTGCSCPEYSFAVDLNP